jgi:hypothetical protein
MLPVGHLKAEEVFQSSEIEGLRILSKSPLPDGSFVRNGKSFLEGVLLHLLTVPTELPRHYSQFYETEPPYRT